MSRTKLDLGSSGTIDLSDEIAYSLNFAIADIRSPDKRDASYSKTIRIPGSKTNDRIFQHIWNIDMDCNFNPNIKAECVLSIDELQQLKGYLQLLRVYKTDEKKLEYEVTIRGQVGNIFTSWGTQELTDIDYSDLNHYYLKSVQKATWSATVGERYVYPLIDFGLTNGTTYDTTNFFPALYLKEYIDRMFKLAGYTYNSSFFTSSFFKHLIVPYNELTLKYKADTYTPREIEVINDVTTQVFALTSTPTNPNTTVYQWDNIVVNPSSQFNLATGKATIVNSGNYDISYNVGLYRVTTATCIAVFYLVRERAGVFTYYGQCGGVANTSFVVNNNYQLSSNVPLQAGDKVFIGIGAVVPTGSFNLEIQNGGTTDLWIRPSATSIADGSIVDMNEVIPVKIKISDFFNSIIKMFNLYVDEDKNFPNLLNIEPRNDFYADGVIVDWTNKLDTSQPLVIEPMGQLDSVKYQFTYKEDSDYWNKKYKDAHQQVYSEMDYIVTNDFLKNTNKTEVIFSPTPQVNAYQTDRIIPQIIGVDSNGSIEPVKAFNIRILYYGGVKNTVNSWTYSSFIEGNTTETTYPYCGMVDNPALPDVALDFGVPLEVYYSTQYYSNNNLFNKYYRQFIEEITDKDSKIVTGYFALTPADILKLDFKNEFFIQGNFLRLNKIFDYNPINTTLTKCEFIKIKQASPFVRQTSKLDSGLFNFTVDIKPMPINPSDIPHMLIGNTVIGADNVVSTTARGAIVTGTRNSVGNNTRDISILNSSGITVYPDITGATIINSSGIIVRDNGVTYINNVRVIDATSFDLYKTKDNITAYAGGGQANATELTAERNIVDTVTTLGDSVKCDLALVGKSKTIFNNGANDLYLYPAVGDGFINGSTSIGADLKIIIGAGNTISMVCYADKLWRF